VHFFVDNFLIKLYANETLDYFSNDFSYYKYILRLKVSSLIKLASTISNEFAE